MIEEIPTPIALLFSAYIIGSGYLTLNSMMKNKFEMLRDFDKFILSLTFGSLGFALSIALLQIDINLTNSANIIEFIKFSPLYFFFNIIFTRIIFLFWTLFQNIFFIDLEN